MIHQRFASPLATAQLLAAATCSVHEVLNSLFAHPVTGVSKGQGASCTFSSSGTSYSSSAEQQQLQRIPDGPGLADFIRASSQATTGFGLESTSSSSPASHGHEQQEASLSKRVFIETYGCQMNVNDSEVIASVLSAQQYSNAQSAAEAGIVLLNTCAIRYAPHTHPVVYCSACSRTWIRCHLLDNGIDNYLGARALAVLSQGSAALLIPMCT